jgi:hypothetical protein
MREWHDRLPEEIPNSARLLKNVHAFLGRRLVTKGCDLLRV